MQHATTLDEVLALRSENARLRELLDRAFHSLHHHVTECEKCEPLMREIGLELEKE